MSNEVKRFRTGEDQQLTQRFAHRAELMQASEIRALFAVVVCQTSQLSLWR